MAQSDEEKQRIRDAIGNFEKRSEPKVNYEKKKYGAPEKALEAEALVWLRTNGFHITVVESKATFNPHAGRYISQAVKQGFVDLVGNHNSGTAVFIELKAPGKRSTLRPNQRVFLLDKIETGCFAVCVDSVDLLMNQWNEFLKLRRANQIGFAKDFLRTALPTERAVKDFEALFPEE